MSEREHPGEVPMSERWSSWIAGKRAASGDDVIEVHHPFDGALVAAVSIASTDDVERAVTAAQDCRKLATGLPAHVRADALSMVSRRLEARAEEIAALVTAESGKPIKWARIEVGRAVSTFRWAAEETRRWGGTLQRLDTDASSEGRVAVVRRFPRGPVLGITPFNFPLNLVAHKLAPAIAVGAPVIIKPAPKTPLGALVLAEILAETDLPAGLVSVLVVPDERAPALTEDPRLPVVSFTGSDRVGFHIQAAVPAKHVTLELGGNAAVMICADWRSDADLELAATRIAMFANYQAGQSCIAVQRVLVDRSLYDEFLPRLVAEVRTLGVGDPRDEGTDVGPLIDEAAARRVEEAVEGARAAGATIVLGGRRSGSSYEPTVLVDVPADSAVVREEIFGPVVVVIPFDGAEDGFARVNDSRFGLQAGIFTHDLTVAFRAHRELEVGGVVIGDVPSYRADQMPYGGAKDSGTGREGVRYAMEDLTYERVLVLTGIDL